jgi:dipeptidyl aminopeptidase/acylaminoacyl peptidase
MNAKDLKSLSKELTHCKKIKLNSKVADVLSKRFGEDFFKQSAKQAKKLSFYQIRYKSRDKEIYGFLIQPKKITGNIPAIIFNRGGSEEFGSIKSGQIFGQLATMASWGYVVLASQYTDNLDSYELDEFGGSDIDDVLNLRKIIKQLPYTDENRIGMIGGSRGGMMTYLSLSKVKWVRAAVSIAGLSDLFNNQKYRPEMKPHFKKMFGGKKEDLESRSAKYWADKFHKKSPLLLLHGTADWRVDVTDSLQLAERLYLYNLPYKLVVYPGADHVLSEYREESMIEIKNWLQKYVTDLSPMPNLKKHGK